MSWLSAKSYKSPYFIFSNNLAKLVAKNLFNANPNQVDLRSRCFLTQARMVRAQSDVHGCRNDVPITIGSNISSLRAQTELTKTTRSLSQSFERLSSGLRINHAMDDSAGLALAMALKTDAIISARGMRNLSDGISALNIADAALSELVSIVTRIKELATEAANGTFTSTQRQALDAEAQALQSEYSRIASSTKFNGRNLIDGSFDQVSLQAGSGTNSTLTVDIDSVASAFAGSTTTTIGTGTFQTGVSYAGPFNTSHTLAVDADGDGKRDLITTGAGGNTEFRVGNGNGTFQAVSQTFAFGGGATRFISADLNNDGKIDLIGGVGSTNMRVLMGNGNGTFLANVSYATSSFVDDPIAADVNSDGILDLVGPAANDDAISILIGNGNGTFLAQVSYISTPNANNTQSAAVVDVNGDGKLDVLAGSSSGPSPGSIGVFINNGNGTFSLGSSYLGGNSTAVTLRSADFNGDTFADVIMSQSGSINIFLGNGNATFKAPLSYASGGWASEIAIGDLNGDGKQDVVTADNVASTVSVLFGNGNGSFKANATITAWGVPESVQLADLNADSVLDIVTGSFTTNNGGIFLANTTTSTSASTSVSLLTQTLAQSAMTTADTVLSQISTEQSRVGAYLSRLAVATNMLESRVEVMESAYSRIVDIDVATEVTKLVSAQIKQQAATAILAQANLNSSLVLKLF